MIYIDTHVAAWLYAARSDLLSDLARQEIEENEVLVSPMVLLELEFLKEIGRLAVGGHTVCRELERTIGIKVCELGFLDAIRCAIDLTWTRDPFDRVIVGQAQAASRDLVTRDEVIRANFPRARW